MLCGTVFRKEICLLWNYEFFFVVSFKFQIYWRLLWLLYNILYPFLIYFSDLTLLNICFNNQVNSFILAAQSQLWFWRDVCLSICSVTGVLSFFLLSYLCLRTFNYNHNRTQKNPITQTPFVSILIAYSFWAMRDCVCYFNISSGFVAALHYEYSVFICQKPQSIFTNIHSGLSMDQTELINNFNLSLFQMTTTHCSWNRMKKPEKRNIECELFLAKECKLFTNFVSYILYSIVSLLRFVVFQMDLEFTFSRVREKENKTYKHDENYNQNEIFKKTKNKKITKYNGSLSIFEQKNSL